MLKRTNSQMKLKLKNFMFEMHSIAPFNPTFAGIMLAIDYTINIVMVAYMRIYDISKNMDTLFIKELQFRTFINVYLYIPTVSIIINSIIVLSYVYLFILILLTDPNKPRRKGSAWQLRLLIMMLYSMNTCFSILIIYCQIVNTFCPWPLPNFSCLNGPQIYYASVSYVGWIFMLFNSFLLENIYNFQFMGINGERGILTNCKRLSMLPIFIKYFTVVFYISAWTDTVTSGGFICVSLMYLVMLYLKFTQSYYF